MSYVEQWQILRAAIAAGWTGCPPSVLGSYYADKSVHEAATFLGARDADKLRSISGYYADKVLTPAHQTCPCGKPAARVVMFGREYVRCGNCAEETWTRIAEGR